MNLRLSQEEIKIIDNIKIGCEELIKLIIRYIKISRKICQTGFP
jgi:hypothetical protein